MKKTSIITVNYNNKRGLERTIKSVVSQTYPNIEYIVIDGGSSDGSKEFIENNKDNIAYWVSEKDGGIYDAMNKGIAKASGEYLLFLNSGDYLKDKFAIERVTRKGLTADLEIYRQKFEDGGVTPVIKKEDIKPSYFISSVFPHQGTFIKKRIIDKVGGYRTDYKIVSDWIFCFEAVVKYKCTYNLNRDTFSVMERGGVSSSMDKCHNEMSRFLNECMADKYITWDDIYPISEKSQRQDYCDRNPLSSILNKVAIWIGKRL
jgi:glycosyltransferase involved in cell wall biosynthesis